MLAAGRGLRSRVLGRSWPKSLWPVLDRPLIAWQLAALRALDVRETVVVIGHLGTRLREALAHAPEGPRLTWVEQLEPRGIADALACAAEHLESPFVCLLGDVFFEAADLARVAAALEGADAVVGVAPRPHPSELERNFAVHADASGRVLAVEEKPRVRGGAKGIGLYAFRPEFLAHARTVPPSPLRGERELTDALQAYLEGGAHVRAVACTGRDFNLSGAADLLGANLHALAASGRASWIDPRAEVEPGARIARSIVLAGARVDSGARLDGSLVFPDERVPAGDYASVVFVAGEAVACAACP